MKPLAPNTLLQNRYLIVHLIGKGGMGEVYLAVDQRLGSAIALKRTFFSDDETLGTAFEREARTLARLRHPVLPKVSDHFTENDTQYLVMEHITGDDLAKRLELTDKPFPLNWVLFWADQLLDALAYLHGHEPPIVHRDIKPQNLKLTDENHIVLLDFGLAKNSIENTRVSSTTGGSIVGYTPHYAPMEQIRGTGTNPRSDIYSFSATFYQLLTNVVPADALTRADSVLNGAPDPVQPISEINIEVPKLISDVFLKGMALSMEQRYSNARDMQKALREAFSQMQTAMAAQTMAFNAPTGVQNQAMPQSQQQTEQFATSLPSQLPEQNLSQQPAPPAFNSLSNSETIPASTHQPQNFDATMKYDSGALPLGEKTEVIPFDKLPKAEDYSSKAKREDSDSTGFAKASEDDFNPEATIPPMVSYEETGAEETRMDSNFNSQPKTEMSFAPAATVVPNTNFSQPEPAFIPAAPVSAEPQKKSGGKGLAIAAGIGGLGIVAVGAAAIGWYALKPSEPTVPASPSPQVETVATPTIEPTIEPTVEPSIEAVTNPTDSSTDITSSPESSTGDTQNQRSVVSSEKNNSQKSTQQTVQPTPARVVPTPRVVAVKTPQPQKTPAQAKTPAKSTRTDILQ